MIRASGLSGLLRVGYQWAADLGPWSLDPTAPRVFTLRSVITMKHSFWSAQEPLDLVLSIGSVEWLWRAVDVRSDDGVIISIELRETPIVSECAAVVR